jgi:hypothetical protein
LSQVRACTRQGRRGIAVQLTALGVTCEIVASTLVPAKPVDHGERVLDGGGKTRRNVLLQLKKLGRRRDARRVGPKGWLMLLAEARGGSHVPRSARALIAPSGSPAPGCL